MYHHYRKDSSYLRSAIWDEYKHKCFYCTHIVALRDMHIDHILPTNAEKVYDAEIHEYLSELQKNDFDFDSIENYAPTCPSCNIDKSNKVYNASSLRYYHDKAYRHVDAVLQRIYQLQQRTKEYFYSPVDASIWETIDFSNQHDISYAILGYRLTPKDVEACPRFPQVERIKKRLTMVHHVNLQGETGCGKSISVYQAAYDFFLDGWKVYRYINQESESATINIPSNTENSLYIVDDAQTLSNAQKRHLQEQAKFNLKVLFSETIASQDVYHDTILLTNTEAVNILYSDFMRRKNEILPIIHKIDPEVGEDHFDTSIEWRLDNAKKETTPWMFAYVLRGGWRTIKENFQAVSSRHNCDLLAAGIAAYQIAQLDNSVNFEWLCNKIHSIDSSYMWDQSDLRYLVNMKIVFSEEDIRIVHLESANALFGYFYMHASVKKKRIILNMIETSYLENILTTLGMVWLSNGPSRHISDDWQYERELISEKTISHTFLNINQANSRQERIGIAYLWEKLFRRHFHHIGYTYFCQNNIMIREWINHANGEVAYAYSCLINSLRNYNKMQHRKFSKSVDWKMITSSLQDATSAELYSWGKLINRLACSFTQNDCLAIQIELDKALRAIQKRITINNIESFSSFLCMLAYITPECVYEMIHVSLPIYHQLFSLETRKMLQVFDLDFFMYICGIGFFVNHKPTKQQTETSEDLIRIIPDEQFANVISNSTLCDWDQVYVIMNFITMYNEAKSRIIIKKVDLHQLTNSARGSWNKAQDITLLCLALYFGDPSVAQQFIASNADEIETVYPSFAIIHPTFAISSFLVGKEVRLIDDFHWQTSYTALKTLIKTNKTITCNIILSNETFILKELSDISTVDLEDDYCYRFISLLQKTSPQIFLSIAEQIDISAIGKGIEKSSSSKRKQMAKEKRLQKIKSILSLKKA